MRGKDSDGEIKAEKVMEFMSMYKHSTHLLCKLYQASVIRKANSVLPDSGRCDDLGTHVINLTRWLDLNRARISRSIGKFGISYACKFVF